MSTPETHDGEITLSELELRLEVSKAASNAVFDFLERLKDRRSIVERYRSGDVHLHIHFLSSQRVSCLTIKRHPVDFGQVRVEAGPDVNSGFAAGDDELPMFILVREVAEAFCPVASVVRLQSLDRCDMGGIDAFEKGTLAASVEVLFRVHDWKLRAALFGARVQFGQFKDEIIEGASEIVANLPDQDSDTHSEERFRWAKDIYSAVRRMGIYIERDGIGLTAENTGDLDCQLSKVFACPPFSLEAAVQRVNAVIDHERNYTSVVT